MCGRFVSARKRLELPRSSASNGTASPADPTRSPARLQRGAHEAGVRCRWTPARDEESRRAARARAARGALGPDPVVGQGRLGRRAAHQRRAETVAVKPAFRRAFARRRCILPADGYYEWQAVTEQGKTRKQPYYIFRKDGGELAFAGIYDLWRDEALPDDHDRAWLWTAAIITTNASDDVGQIHDRMPMTITPDHWADWLDPDQRPWPATSDDGARHGRRPHVIPRIYGCQLSAEQRTRAR